MLLKAFLAPYLADASKLITLCLKFKYFTHMACPPLGITTSARHSFSTFHLMPFSAFSAYHFSTLPLPMLTASRLQFVTHVILLMHVTLHLYDVEVICYAIAAFSK